MMRHRSLLPETRHTAYSIWSLLILEPDSPQRRHMKTELQRPAMSTQRDPYCTATILAGAAQSQFTAKGVINGCRQPCAREASAGAGKEFSEHEGEDGDSEHDPGAEAGGSSNLLRAAATLPLQL